MLSLNTVLFAFCSLLTKKKNLNETHTLSNKRYEFRKLLFNRRYGESVVKKLALIFIDTSNSVYCFRPLSATNGFFEIYGLRN